MTFNDDYTFLSALTHPVGLVLWSGDTVAWPPVRITEAQAELLAKVAASGPGAVGHHTLALAAEEAAIILPDPKTAS